MPAPNVVDCFRPRAHRRLVRAALGTTLGVAALAWTPSARAGGFEIPDIGARAGGRGGAFTVGASDLTAIHYNPGALAKQRGTTLLYNHNLVFHDTRFQRATLSDAWGPDAGTEFPEVRNAQKLFGLGVFAVVASDFGLDNWTFAAGVYGPSSVGKHDYPEYGPQSFILTDMDILLAYYTLGAAWKLRDVFGIGATVQYVDLIQMKYALVTDARVPNSDLDPIADDAGTQVTTEMQLKDRTAATAQLGLWYRPHERIEVGAASRFIPVFLEPEGGVAVDKEELTAGDVRAKMDLVLPANARAGVRYIHPHPKHDGELFDIELDVVYENWASIDAYDVKFDGRLNGQEIQDLRIEKNWNDTVSVRLGSDVHVLPPYLTVRAGGYWESPATPKNYSHLDFPSFQRGGIGAGITGGYRGVYLTVGFMHVFQEKREIDELRGKVYQLRPIAPCPDACNDLSGVPANAGTWRSRYELLNVGLELRFAELLGKRKKKRKQPEAAQPAATRPTGGEDAATGALGTESASESETASEAVAESQTESASESQSESETDAESASNAGSEPDGDAASDTDVDVPEPDAEPEHALGAA